MTKLREVGRRYGLLALVTTAIAVTGCSGSNNDDDTGVVDRDGGVRDGGPPPDAGVRALCTIPENTPACMVSEDCSTARAPQAECPTCPSDYEGVCLTGQCAMPERIPSGNTHVLNIGISGFEGQVKALVGIAIAAETAGGNTLTCAEATGMRLWEDWQNPCYNVLRTRYLELKPPIAQTYKLNFSGFASGQRTLFITYGFDELTINVDPIAVTCTEYDVGEPGSGFVEIMGDNLVLID